MSSASGQDGGNEDQKRQLEQLFADGEDTPEWHDKVVDLIREFPHLASTKLDSGVGPVYPLALLVKKSLTSAVDSNDDDKDDDSDNVGPGHVTKLHPPLFGASPA